VAIRITRPYQTEDEFLARELDTISRTGVTLVGAQPRPEGVVLRFELALATGAPLLRGEGRVISYKAAAMGSEPGLSLRFTRLDSKSKSFVDRVGSMRDVRRSIPPPPPSARSAPPPAPEPTPSADAIPIAVDFGTSSADALPAIPPSSPNVASPSVVKAPAHGTERRENVLARLRKHGSQMQSHDVERILADGAARRTPRT